MRLIFFGTSAFAVPSLKAVAARHQVVMCVTQPDRPQGRGLGLEPSPVKQAALELGVPLSQPDRPQAGAWRALKPDIGVVIAYGHIIRRELLELPAHGMVGVHPSLLPKYRGAAPVPWALLHGETTTGVTIFRLSERLDDGDVIVQETVAIEPREQADALLDRLADIGARALVNALGAIETGRATFHPQDHAQASFAPKLTKAQGQIDWRAPAQTIERLVRAVVPWPGAMTSWHGRPLKVWAAWAIDAPSRPAQAVPGTVMAADATGLIVSAGAGAVQIEDVQPAGRRRMRVSEFLAGHPVRIGERFGTQDPRPKTHDTKH